MVYTGKSSLSNAYIYTVFDSMCKSYTNMCYLKKHQPAGCNIYYGIHSIHNEYP